MKRADKLVLNREALSGLVADDLGDVVGASLPTGTTSIECSGPCVTYTCPTSRCTLRCALLSEGGRCA